MISENLEKIMSEIRKMRATALLLGCLLLTGIFAGCGKKEETPANTVSVYYILSLIHI